MYQTVGQDAIEIVAQALDVPLYRRVISGAAVEQGSEYGTRSGGDATGVQGDETEDLLGLLSSVKVNTSSFPVRARLLNVRSLDASSRCAGRFSGRHPVKLPTRSRRACVCYRQCRLVHSITSTPQLSTSRSYIFGISVAT
jgi:hypothetical protein